ncbi:hypothetical protein TNCV_2488491 [Trichonephila clavipes]|nr:hypothetical protein TNCV_2488491 [Trichonephila clavipes]
MVNGKSGTGSFGIVSGKTGTGSSGLTDGLTSGIIFRTDSRSHQEDGQWQNHLRHLGNTYTVLEPGTQTASGLSEKERY